MDGSVGQLKIFEESKPQAQCAHLLWVCEESGKHTIGQKIERILGLGLLSPNTACTCSVKLMTFLLNVVRGVPEMFVTEAQAAEAGAAVTSPTEVEDVEAQEGGAIPPEELVAMARLDSLLRVALRSRINFCPC